MNGYPYELCELISYGFMIIYSFVYLVNDKTAIIINPIKTLRLKK